MSINVELTNEQFYHLYKDNEFLSGMSIAAVDEVLEHISEISTDQSEVVDWTAFFMNANEYTSEEFIRLYEHHVHEDDLEAADGDEDELAQHICESINHTVRRFFVGDETFYVVLD